MIKSPTGSDRCGINMLATGCAELRRWVSALTDTGITETTLEAFAKFDYATWPALCMLGFVWLGCHTHKVEVKLSGLVVDSVNERLMHGSIIDFSSVSHGLWISEFYSESGPLLIAACQTGVPSEGLDAKRSWIINLRACQEKLPCK